MFGLKNRRRRRARSRPTPASWGEILWANVPAFQRLPQEDRLELIDHIKVFIEEKRFEGINGQEITEEVRVTIAAQACMLLLHRDTDYYPRIRSILVYPERYVAPYKRQGPGGIVTEGTDTRLGEAWDSGYVVLSWCDVKRGGVEMHDGHNVVFHEFAHALDAESGFVDGAPALEKRELFRPWARMLAHELSDLRAASMRGLPTVLNKYGAQNEAEFFAVATEAFFERPAALRASNPEVYQHLGAYYRQDPAAWVDQSE